MRYLSKDVNCLNLKKEKVLEQYSILHFDGHQCKVGGLFLKNRTNRLNVENPAIEEQEISAAFNKACARERSPTEQ